MNNNQLIWITTFDSQSAARSNSSRGPSIFLDKSGGYARSENFRNWNPIGNSMNFRRRSLMTGYLTFNWVSQGFRCNGLRFAPNCRCSQLTNLTTIVVSGNVLVYNNPGTTTNHEYFWHSISLQYLSLGSVLSHATKEVTRMRKIREVHREPHDNTLRPCLHGVGDPGLVG